MKAKGILNNTSVSNYYHNESTAGIHEVAWGKSLLSLRNVLDHVMKAANRFTAPFLGITHNVDKERAELGDLVEADLEKL